VEILPRTGKKSSCFPTGVFDRRTLKLLSLEGVETALGFGGPSLVDVQTFLMIKTVDQKFYQLGSFNRSYVKGFGSKRARWA
jgi:hypothetical protein